MPSRCERHDRRLEYIGSDNGLIRTERCYDCRVRERLYAPAEVAEIVRAAARSLNTMDHLAKWPDVVAALHPEAAALRGGKEWE